MIGQKRDGRREYDNEARDELVRLCLKPGVSIARTAMEHDVNPNLLRTWVTQFRQKQAGRQTVMPIQERQDSVLVDVSAATNEVLSPGASAASFVPVVAATTTPLASPPSESMTLALHVRLSNGVEIELGKAIATIEELTTLLQILGRLPCSGSTTT
ncbi:transposase [Burkholderia cenocepacia]|uniref:transposase n=1 Tax=Burkholderia cenocepacia TaxID=95486 RepID=UPI0028654A79|nr:transposase [Burkholderia cenocepacia]MDR5644438.1 transposase [Burkholderia cenocepacia]